jgi:hypothetical protein
MLHLSEPGALSKPQISHQVSYIYLFKCIYITIYFIHNYIIYNCIVIYLYLYCIILCFIWLYVYIKLCIYIYIISVFTYYYHYILLYPWFEVPELAKSPAGSREPPPATSERVHSSDGMSAVKEAWHGIRPRAQTVQTLLDWEPTKGGLSHEYADWTGNKYNKRGSSPYQ